MTGRQRRHLEGRKILVVDDELLIAMDLEAAVEDAGADVVGPCTTLAAALKAAEVEGIAAAVLDIRLGKETIDPLAVMLAERSIPIVFYSGQKLPEELQRRLFHYIVVDKPGALTTIIEALVGLLEMESGDRSRKSGQI